MYHVTEAMAALFDSEQYQILRITGTDSGGNAISITAENVMVNGFNIDRYCCNSNRLEIGTAVAAEMTLKLNNADGTFDSINFEGAELFVEIGIADWTQTNPTINWIPCGYYTPDEQPRNRTIITLSALDRMMRFEKEFETSEPEPTLIANYTGTTPSTLAYYDGYYLTDTGSRARNSVFRLWYLLADSPMDVYLVPLWTITSSGDARIAVFSGQPYGSSHLESPVYTAYNPTNPFPTAENPLHVEAGQYVSFSGPSEPWELYSIVGGIEFPITVNNLVTNICSACDVTLATSISAMPNATLAIPSLPETQESITYRNVIQWCAGLMGTNAFIDWNGQLRFAWYSDTGYTSTPDRRFSSDLYENDITVTGVTYTDAEQTTHLAGTATYTLDMSDNALIATLDANNIDAVLQSVNVVTQGFTYRPFEAKAFAAPWLFPMDRVTFTDLQGVTHLSALTNVNLTINGETSLKSSGETAQTNSYAGSYGITAEQAVVLRRVLQSSNEQIEAAVAEATSQITGAENSHVKFIYDENGGLSEILVMDTDDINTAVNVWRWNSGGLGHSSNGYNGNYTLAMTQNGSIVATMITTGILNASVIKAGIISDVNGYNSWNLATGAMTMRNGSINIGNGAFVVDTSGGLTAKSANINGTITSADNDKYITITQGLIDGGAVSVDTYEPIGMLYFVDMSADRAVLNKCAYLGGGQVLLSASGDGVESIGDIYIGDHGDILTNQAVETGVQINGDSIWLNSNMIRLGPNANDYGYTGTLRAVYDVKSESGGFRKYYNNLNFFHGILVNGNYHQGGAD